MEEHLFTILKEIHLLKLVLLKVGDPDLTNIILTTDPTCTCEEKFINAEIITQSG